MIGSPARSAPFAARIHDRAGARFGSSLGHVCRGSSFEEGRRHLRGVHPDTISPPVGVFGCTAAQPLGLAAATPGMPNGGLIVERNPPGPSGCTTITLHPRAAYLVIAKRLRAPRTKQNAATTAAQREQKSQRIAREARQTSVPKDIDRSPPHSWNFGSGGPVRQS